MELTLINGKYELWLPEHRAMRPEWKTGWEVERIESMLSVLKKGDLVLDIGTEEGDISALLAQKTNNIIMFEPNEKVWPNILSIFRNPENKLNDPLGVFVGFASNKTDFKGKQQHEVMTTNGEVGHAISYPDCAYGELIGNHGFKELIDAGQIPEIKIDDFMHDINRTVKLITIDVEGSEFEVIKGATNLVKEDKPYIFISVHPEFMFRMFGQYTAELVKYITDLGYTQEVLAFDHEFHFKFTPI